MSGVQRLTGITWNHTRGFLPLVATAQRFAEIHMGVEIVWQKRLLQAFGDQPLEQLAPQFDLLVIDHPFVGYAAANPVILALDEYLSAEFLADQAANSVGKSGFWKLPIQSGTTKWQRSTIGTMSIVFKTPKV